MDLSILGRYTDKSMSFLYSLILFWAPKVWEQTHILLLGVEYNAAESTSQLT